MDVPRNCLYTRDHFWLRPEGDQAVVGVTDHLQRELGAAVLADLPEVGEDVEAFGSFGIIESDKTVSDLTCPVSGEVTEINGELADTPELINEDPYGEGWLVRILLSEAEQLSALMTPEEYEEYVADLVEEE